MLGLTSQSWAQQLGFNPVASPQVAVAGNNVPNDSPPAGALASTPLITQVNGSVCVDGQSDKCQASCPQPCCCLPCFQFYGEYLLLRPGDERISYAVPANGLVVPPAGSSVVAIGNEASLDHGFGSGFRIGGTHALDCDSSIGVEYTYYDNGVSGSTSFNQPVLASLVQHPATVAATGFYLNAAAAEDLRFQLADVDYRHVFASNECSTLNYLVGLRYGNLHQAFRSTFTNTTTVEQVNSNGDFDGLGLRAGLEGERRSASGWLVYGKTSASFVGGVFRESYFQGDNFRGTVVQTGWDQDRVITILEGEVGVGWTNANGNLRLTIGYSIEGWLNTILTRDFISTVQNGTSNQSTYLSDTLTFDGMVARAELRF
jgi:hypothetical protein